MEMPFEEPPYLPRVHKHLRLLQGERCGGGGGGGGWGRQQIYEKNKRKKSREKRPNQNLPNVPCRKLRNEMFGLKNQRTRHFVFAL